MIHPSDCFTTVSYIHNMHLSFTHLLLIAVITNIRASLKTALGL
jgi:hypothetical protein